MKGKSILLALSGSEQSHHATQVCWDLARRLGTTITAHHVIDSHSAWEFLGYENPGFLAAGTYLEPYQQLVSSLFILGKELARSYASQAMAAGIDDVCLLDEGNPITEICRRSVNHKMVVIGHRATRTLQPRSQFMRRSVAEALAHDCPRPLLIVQDKCPPWKSLSIVLSPDHINEVYINSCLDMAKALDLPPALLCLSGGACEEKPEDFLSDMRQANRRLSEIPVTLASWQRENAEDVQSWGTLEGCPLAPGFFQNTLLVIPTRMVANERLTVIDSSPSLFVRNLQLPSILLFPEEYAFSGFLSPAGAEKAMAGRA